jgi:hypothetical protein
LAQPPTTAPRRAGPRPRGLTEADCATLAKLRVLNGASTGELGRQFGMSGARIYAALATPYMQEEMRQLHANLEERVAAAYRTLQHCAHAAASNIAAAVEQGDLRESRFVLETLLPKQTQRIEGTVEHNHQHAAAVQLVATSLDRLTALMGGAPASVEPERFLLRGAEGASPRSPTDPACSPTSEPPPTSGSSPPPRSFPHDLPAPVPEAQRAPTSARDSAQHS